LEYLVVCKGKGLIIGVGGKFLIFAMCHIFQAQLTILMESLIYKLLKKIKIYDGYKSKGFSN
jgi:hypothetical protein